MEEELTREEIKEGVVQSIEEYEEFSINEATQNIRPVLFNNSNEDDKDNGERNRISNSLGME